MMRMVREGRSGDRIGLVSSNRRAAEMAVYPCLCMSSCMSTSVQRLIPLHGFEKPSDASTAWPQVRLISRLTYSVATPEPGGKFLVETIHVVGVVSNRLRIQCSQ